MSNLAGLDQLQQRRTSGRKERQIPPPKHAKRSGDYPNAADAPVEEPIETRGVAAVQPNPAPVGSAAEPETLSAVAKGTGTSTASTTAAVAPGIKVTLYLDEVLNDFMESAAFAGRTCRPRVDISRSAVVRLALRRLMADMTPEQVKEHLADHTAPGDRPGRKRR